MGNKAKVISFAAFIAAVFLFIFRGAFESGSALFGHDLFIIYHPFRIFADYVFRNFNDLPLWMPNLFFGIPMIASSSLLYYYPTDILFMLLGISPMQSVTIDAIIHLYAAYIGMYLFLRRENLSPEASFAGGIFIMLAGYTLSFINAGHINNIKAGALIPLVFYFLRSGLLKNSLKHWLSAGLVMGLQVMATGMQVMAYTMIGAAMFVTHSLITEKKETKARVNVIMLFAGAFVFSLLFSAAQFLPSYDYKDFSWRGEFTYESFISWSQHPLEFLTMLFPHIFGLKENTYFGFMSLNLTTYYMGLLPFLLSPLAFMYKKERRIAAFWAICALVFLLLSFGGFTPLYALFYKIPVFNQFRNPSRFMYQFSFFIAALGALGFDTLLKNRLNEKINGFLKYTGIIMAGFGVLSALVVLTRMPEQTVKFLYQLSKDSAIPSGGEIVKAAQLKADLLVLAIYCIVLPVLGLLAIKGKLKSALVAALVLVSAHTLDVYRVEKEFVKYIPQENLVPYYDAAAELIKNSPEKGRLADFSYLWGPNRPLYYNIEAVKGGHGMQPLFFGKMESSGIFNQLNANRAINIRWYAMNSDISFPGFVKKAQGKFALYEDTLALGRVTFTSQYLKVKDDEEALAMMSKGLFDGSRALVAFEPPFMPSVSGNAAQVKINDYAPNAVKFTVISGVDGFAQLSNLFYKRIKAKVDGKDAKVYRINYAFTGIVVPKGTHEVSVYYGRGVETAGLIITLLSLAAFAAVCLYNRNKIKAGAINEQEK